MSAFITPCSCFTAKAVRDSYGCLTTSWKTGSLLGVAELQVPAALTSISNDEEFKYNWDCI